MNKLERRKKGYFKYKRRLRNYGIEGDDHSLKTTGRPCSCPICKRPRYNRKRKHKHNNNE